MLRAVIVDDEIAAIRVLMRLLAAHPEIEVVGVAATATEARRLIDAVRPDVAFLDVELGAETGFSLVEGAGRPKSIVFVTAHPAHAVEAFSVEAADFLVKPVDAGRLAETVRRLLRRNADPAALAPIVLRLSGRTLLVPPTDIIAFTAEDDFTRVWLADGGSLLILKTLSQFDALAPGPPFLRLDRSLILNIGRVRGLVVKDRNSATVTADGLQTPLAIGRTALARLRAALTAQSRERAPG